MKKEEITIEPASRAAGFLFAPAGLIHLDNAMQPVADGANHSPVQPLRYLCASVAIPSRLTDWPSAAASPTMAHESTTE